MDNGASIPKTAFRLEFGWSEAPLPARPGAKTCTLFADGLEAASCQGGGYDMEGAVLGSFIQTTFTDRLRLLMLEYCATRKPLPYGVTLQNGSAIIDGASGKEVALGLCPKIGIKVKYVTPLRNETGKSYYDCQDTGLPPALQPRAVFEAVCHDVLDDLRNDYVLLDSTIGTHTVISEIAKNFSMDGPLPKVRRKGAKSASGTELPPRSETAYLRHAQSFEARLWEKIKDGFPSDIKTKLTPEEWIGNQMAMNRLRYLMVRGWAESAIRAVEFSTIRVTHRVEESKDSPGEEQEAIFNVALGQIIETPIRTNPESAQSITIPGLPGRFPLQSGENNAPTLDTLHRGVLEDAYRRANRRGSEHLYPTVAGWLRDVGSKAQKIENKNTPSKTHRPRVTAG